ncbi:SRPBCC family protein [Pararhizobium antarcticum]|uniref:Carbon monoxide dehydrogenase n=1 Tax=Pararhizobium antarcticum TaxID=1798805 RepID=A0A657LVP9_9HYPH|nr:carbon monoxide dehydrogenase subunit G [Pararhizobium antarcticum]OJF95686.1 carbon monoxide dehydrogenase [Rhizobium sp. 58]OJF99434.1 carbon monoxide dehydrogenase [Pararhizobium antarcticum]
MDMNGSQRIEASRETVFAGLNDVDILRQCIPGCESIEKTSDTEMVAKVTLRIGPVKASFAGNVTLSDLDPPNGYTISGEGSGGMAGFAKGGAKVTLEPDGDATILNYTVTAEIGGKLAQMGSRLIDSTAKKLAGDFFAKFGAVVGTPVAVEAPAEEAPVEAAASKGWMSRILGTSATGFLILALTPGLCCITGDHSAMANDMMMSSICTSGSVM